MRQEAAAAGPEDQSAAGASEDALERDQLVADTQTEPFLSYVLQEAAAAGPEDQSAAGASEDALGRDQLVAVMGGLRNCLRNEHSLMTARTSAL